jgi:hypothetical protein
MIKFRQKQYTEVFSESNNQSENNDENKGNIIIPSLISIGSLVYGSRKIKKSNEQKKELPGLIKNARAENKKGVDEVNKIKDSWLGTGNYLRQDKIKKVQEAADMATEREMMKVRKTARSAKWNRIKGKAAIGLGIGAAALGAYKLSKQIKRNEED